MTNKPSRDIMERMSLLNATGNILPNMENEVVSRKLTLVKDERYLGLLEEIQVSFIETKFSAAMTLLEGNHVIGRAMVAFSEQTGNHPTPMVREVARDLKYSERNIWNIYRIAKRYVTVQDVVSAMEASGWEGKTPTFTAAVRVLLNSGDSNESELDLSSAARRIIRRYGPEDAKVIANQVLSILSQATG